MGNILKDTKSKIIIVGLDNAGKSTLINCMQPPEVSLFAKFKIIYNLFLSLHIKIIYRSDIILIAVGVSSSSIKSIH